jgi:prepilin peptidase CpaA
MKAGIYSLILFQLSMVSWMDIKHAKIKNHWPLLNLLFAASLFWLVPELYQWTWKVLLFPVSMLVAGFFLYLLNIMGAGDSKYISSLFLLIPVTMHWAFLENLIWSTACFASVLLIVKGYRNFSNLKTYVMAQYWDGILKIIRSRFSYAPVILVAWIFFGIFIWF